MGSLLSSNRLKNFNCNFNIIKQRNNVQIVPLPLLIIPLIKNYEPSSLILQVINNNVTSINEFDSDNKTALMWAAERGREDVLRVLLTLGADLESRDADGRSPLLHATRRGDLQSVTHLLRLGADVTVSSTNDGFTALHLACGNECIEITKLLLDCGADPDRKDFYNKTPIYYMTDKHNKEIYLSHIATLIANGKTPENLRFYREELLCEQTSINRMNKYTNIVVMDTSNNTSIYLNAQ